MSKQTPCSQCGTILTDDQQFCPNCGSMKAKTKNRFCGNCGTEVNEEARYCPNCGNEVISSFSHDNAQDPIQETISRDSVTLVTKIVGIIVVLVFALFVLNFCAGGAGSIIGCSAISSENESFSLPDFVERQSGSVKEINVKDYLSEKDRVIYFKIMGSDNEEGYFDTLETSISSGSDFECRTTRTYDDDSASNKWITYNAKTDSLEWGPEPDHGSHVLITPIERQSLPDDGNYNAISTLPYYYTVTTEAGVFEDCICVQHAPNHGRTLDVTFYAPGFGEVYKAYVSEDGACETALLLREKPDSEHPAYKDNSTNSSSTSLPSSGNMSSSASSSSDTSVPTINQRPIASVNDIVSYGSTTVLTGDDNLKLTLVRPDSNQVPGFIKVSLTTSGKDPVYCSEGYVQDDCLGFMAYAEDRNLVVGMVAYYVDGSIELTIQRSSVEGYKNGETYRLTLEE